MTVVHLLSKDDFETVAKNSKLVLVHFFAEWVEQCGHINDILDEMVKQTDFKDVRFTKILAEQVPEVSLFYKVSAVPTLVILRNGKEVDRIQGSDPNQLVSKLRSHMTISKENSPPSKVRAPVVEHPHEGGDLKERLEALVRAAPVMLFMKGTADQPRCGFSRQILEILNQHNVNYKTFDILNDNHVREGLKKFSNWPTYPQLYIEGELVGGLDIVKELVASGEFQAMLPSSASLDDRLKKLTNKSKIMVFMKGNPQNPKCGFSRQIIEILNEAGVKYETFDILEDEEVRQGLKKYSNWPTYPQLYVGGELVGGLDIVKEQKESGELSQILAA